MNVTPGISEHGHSHGELAGAHRAYEDCAVRIGSDEARVIDLPSIASLHNQRHSSDTSS